MPNQLKTRINKGTKNSFPGESRRQSAPPSGEASALEGSKITKESRRGKGGPKLKTPSAEGQQFRDLSPAPPPVAVRSRSSSRLSKTNDFNVDAKEFVPRRTLDESQFPALPPKGSTTTTKDFKRARAISQVLDDAQILRNVRAPERQLDSQGSSSDDDNAPLAPPAGYKVLSTTKPSSKSSKPSKRLKW